MFATSQDVALSFGKQHGHVLRDIDNLIKQEPNLRLSNFGETVVSRENPSGGAPIQSRAYEMDRDGFALLAMGFTSAKVFNGRLLPTRVGSIRIHRSLPPRIPAL
ncbi:Rha family transcriptional regulator [Mesorhizobium sp. ASY16-5R]|uniref:Rha family transcriptional regulator n=1 Tax=Mesorhizobium sp. ASY16-5R TaxID=3445772 RepID=UPI003FA09389